MFTEQQKDFVFFSNLFARHYPAEYKEIKGLLSQCHVRCKTLMNTKDYWCRDYMPIQKKDGKFLKFQYSPDYLSAKKKYITDADVVLKGEKTCEYEFVSSNIIFDGGNAVVCNKKKNKRNVSGIAVVMTEKVFKENPSMGIWNLMTELSGLLTHDIIYLPWDPTDPYGHTDGIIHNIGDGKILANFNGYGKRYAERMRKRLEKKFEIIDLKLSSYDENSWAYINMLQTNDIIIVPGLGLPTDAEALEQIKDLFPDYKDKVFQVNLSKVIKEWGGALNCLTWTVNKEASSKKNMYLQHLSRAMSNMCINYDFF